MKHPVWKLLYKLILVSIPLLLLMLYTLSFPMNYMAVEYSMWAEEKAYTQSSTGASTLILGDSRAKSGLMPAKMSPDTYNMAIGGTTSIEMYYALNRYLKHHDTPENVILIFAPYHFCDIDNWSQTLYYNYLDTPELLEVYKTASSTKDPIVLAPNWFTDTLSFKLRLPNKYLAAQYNAGFTKRRADNLAKYTAVQQALGYTAFGTDPGCDGENYETHHEIFDQSELLKIYYYRLLNLCKDNDINVIIEQSPVNQASYDVTTNDFWTGYESFMREIAAAYPEFTVNPTVIPYENKYFGDSNHLNPDGAEKFTQEFVDKYPEL